MVENINPTNNDKGSNESKTVSEKKSGKKRLKQIIGIVLGVAGCIVLIAPSIAGYLNVSVISTSGQYTGQDCEVELYEGDVVAPVSYTHLKRLSKRSSNSSRMRVMRRGPAGTFL